MGPLPPHLTEFAAFLGELNKETARGAALTAAAFLDDLLARVLNAFFIQNSSVSKLTKGFNAPLGTLSARTAACRALGLISDEEANESKLIRKVRNEFAHRVHASFADNNIRGLCDSLTMSAELHGGEKMDARGKFTTAAVALVVGLTNRAHYVHQKCCKPQDWPR